MNTFTVSIWQCGPNWTVKLKPGDVNDLGVEISIPCSNEHGAVAMALSIAKHCPVAVSDVTC